MPRRPLADAWVRRVIALVLSLVCSPLVVTGEARISYAAVDQDAATLIAGLGTLTGENYQADLELLVAGINATLGTLHLVDAEPASCRQALAFALDCWWMRSHDGTIVLTGGKRLPRGPVEVRTLTSTLRRQAGLQPMIERLLDPWLGGQAGLSYLPAEGQWTATLDADGHSRLIELLSLCERPTAQAISRLPDPALPDLRRTTTVELAVRTWPALIDGLAEAMQVSVSLSSRLRLRTFPVAGIKMPRLPLAQAVERLQENGIATHWSHGVLCLGEVSQGAALREREHPAQRRRIALIPIGHLLAKAVDGELIVAALRRHVAPTWWSLPGAGLEYVAANGCLLVAGDADVQHDVLNAITAIDTLGLELGLAAISTANVRLHEAP